MRRSLALAGVLALTLSVTPFARAENAASPDIETQSGSTTWDQIEGNWVEFKGKVKERWGELTDDDLLQIQGERQQLVGRIQALYGVSLEEAESQVTEWEDSVVAH
ncbi:CsbD family protein [Dongia sp.]|uniref:CsbD family protein n=1 Tax=Dongia sp. TaxID=1977262 RepID=UPI0035B4634C